MEIINGLEAVRPRHRGAVITIGNYDGLHIGHRKILDAVISDARGLKSRSMAITFEPHPIRVLAPEREIRLLTPPEEKARLMERYGVDMLLFIKFTRDFAKMAAGDFIKDVLVDLLGVREVVVGHGYAFGRAKKGTTALLRKRGERFGFKVRVIRNAKIDGDTVSSSRIRSLILWGRLCEAARYLGRPYAITGTVVRGAGRGAKLLGFPTANISTPNEVVPKEGVYAVKAELEGLHYDGVANIGRNPTFAPGKTSGISSEVHILGFSGDIVGKSLRLHFVDRLRDERTFPDAGSLQAQIEKDIRRAREILRKNLPL